MAKKIRFLTSANRDGVAIRNGAEVDYSDEEAIALCKGGLAEPVGWSLDAPAPPADPDETGELDDATPAETTGKKKKA